MQYLQMQQQQLQAIQQQVQGASSPWNMGVAYRVPDSNINLSCAYQQGRANVQISCVPDESVPLLGANGAPTHSFAHVSHLVVLCLCVQASPRESRLVT